MRRGTPSQASAGSEWSRSKAPSCLALILCAAGLPAAQAYKVSILGAQRDLFLQVGTGTMLDTHGNEGGTLRQSGRPRNNPTINNTEVTVQSAEVGTGVRQTLLALDSEVTTSSFDGSVVCGSGTGAGTGPFSAPKYTGRVYVGGFYRRGGSGAQTATLTVETPLNLIGAFGATLPFSTIEWISSGVTATGGSESPTTIPSGSFTSTSIQLLTIASNFWFENCLTFRYSNTNLVPADVYMGQAKFTLMAP
ncbi:hypothetical protein GCM10023165_38030 [Variovorax defluvii]|uniref:Uncharacterized protein n=1 Tax=Variovorax defluvii TaxID=913761 RepID=A0ABP8I3X1_9BURK